MGKESTTRYVNHCLNLNSNCRVVLNRIRLESINYV